MKKLRSLLIGIGIVAFMSGGANAAPFTFDLGKFEINYSIFQNYTPVQNSQNAGGIDIGSMFYGLVQVNSITQTTTAWSSLNNDGTSYTGILAAKVTGVSTSTITNGSLTYNLNTYSLDPLSSGDIAQFDTLMGVSGLLTPSDIATGTVVKLYEGDVAYNYDYSSFTNAVQAFTAGDDWMNFGQASWNSAQTFTVTEQYNPTGPLKAQLQMFTDVVYQDVNFSNPYGYFTNKGPGYNIYSDATLFIPATGQSPRYLTNLVTSYGTDPSSGIVATPEPASMLLLGSGLLGLYGVRRRKAKAA